MRQKSIRKIPVNTEITKIRSVFFKVLSLQGIAFWISMEIPVMAINGKYAPNKSPGVNLTDGAEFFKSLMVSRKEYLVFQTDKAKTNKNDGMLQSKDFRISVRFFIFISKFVNFSC